MSSQEWRLLRCMLLGWPNIARELDHEAIVKLTEGFNGADLQNVWAEGGMFDIRAERDYVMQ